MWVEPCEVLKRDEAVRASTSLLVQAQQLYELVLDRSQDRFAAIKCVQPVILTG